VASTRSASADGTVSGAAVRATPAREGGVASDGRDEGGDSAGRAVDPAPPPFGGGCIAAIGAQPAANAASPAPITIHPTARARLLMIDASRAPLR
jgi:hypothetical protein